MLNTLKGVLNMATYGDKIETKAYPCRFAYISTPNQEGKYTVELIVPKKEAIALNERLYGDNQKLIDANKATAKSPKPKPLYSPVYLYDEEAKEVVIDEETGEKVVDEDVVKFNFKTAKKPKVQFKKGLDSSAIIGSGSIIKLSCCAYSSSYKDKNDKDVPFTALTFDGVRVDELVTYASSSTAFSDDDEYEEEDGDYSDATEPEETEEKPVKKGKKTSDKTPKDF